jgi:hypothetical protein
MEKSNVKMEAQVIFLNMVIIYSSCKWKFVVCPFVNEETNGSYLFANGLNRLNRTCPSVCISIDEHV